MTLAYARSVAAEQSRAGTIAAQTAAVRRTSLLRRCGVLAGPVYLIVFLAQALTRDGFDLLRHPASLLSTGELGWIQITNFLITGSLTIAAALGIRDVLRSRRANLWVARLVATFGAGMVAAGIFSADPADGFPVGTPLGRPTDTSWHGGLHFLVAAVAFTSISLACLIAVRPFARSGHRGRAVFSAATGGLFLITLGGMATGATSPVFTVGLLAAVVLAFGWVAMITSRQARPSRCSARMIKKPG